MPQVSTCVRRATTLRIDSNVCEHVIGPAFARSGSECEERACARLTRLLLLWSVDGHDCLRRDGRIVGDQRTSNAVIN